MNEAAETTSPPSAAEATPLLTPLNALLLLLLLGLIYTTIHTHTQTSLHDVALAMNEAAETTSPPSAAEATPLLTPLNALLLLLLLGLIYTRLRPSKSATALPTPPAPTVFKTFTPPQLQPYNGTNNMPVYLAVRGRVFDVSPGRNFYGPGGPYANFAGRDASRGLACGSFDEEMLTEDLEGPLDRLEDLGQEEMEAMRGWEERFSEKYLVVGKLVPVGHEEAERDA